MSTRKSIPRLSILFVSIAVFMAAAACVTTTTEVSGTISPPNSLGMGSDDDGIQVQFIEVVSDSRCAEGLTCVTAGKADVKFGISVDSGPVEEVILETPPGADVKYKTGDYTVHLLSLQPDPPSQNGVAQGDYKANLSISKSS